MLLLNCPVFGFIILLNAQCFSARYNRQTALAENCEGAISADISAFVEEEQQHMYSKYQVLHSNWCDLSLLFFHLQLTGLFQFTVRLLTETEARFTSVERINHYIKVRALISAAGKVDYVATEPRITEQGRWHVQTCVCFFT